MIFKEVQKIVKAIFFLGTEKINNKSLNKRIGLVNKISFLFSTSSIIYFFPFYFLKLEALYPPVFVTFVFFILCLFLNYKGFFLSSRHCLVLFTSIVIFYFATVLGEKMNVQLVFISVAAIPFVLFNNKEEMKHTFFSFLTVVFAFILLEATEYSLIESYKFPPLIYELFTYSYYLMNVSVILFILSFHNSIEEDAKFEIKQALHKAETAYDRAYESLLESKGIQERVASDAAFGKLVRDIGNELTNLISIVMLLNEMVIQSLKTTLKEFSAFHENERESLSESLQSSNKINNFVDRIAELVKKIHSYGNESDEDIQYFPLHKLVNSVIELSKSNMKLRQITCSIDFSESNPKISGNRILLEQALMNILLNAIESIKRKGSIDIYTRVTDDNKVKISFVDDGEGMTPQMIEKAKKPFFSTKKGHAGLGISSVLKIVDQHNGQLSIESIPNEATVVTIEIPMFIDGLDKI